MTPAKGVRVVVADNDPVVLDLLATDLGLEGYDVIATVPSGEAAAEVCAERRPDVLIVDYRMPPGWNGLETIARIKEAHGAGAYVLYTNYRLPDLRRRAERLGAVFVSKGPLRTLRAVLADVAPRQVTNGR
jgi:CheY-like chemotaxis protein